MSIIRRRADSTEMVRLRTGYPTIPPVDESMGTEEREHQALVVRWLATDLPTRSLSPTEESTGIGKQEYRGPVVEQLITEPPARSRATRVF